MTNQTLIINAVAGADLNMVGGDDPGHAALVDMGEETLLSCNKCDNTFIMSLYMLLLWQALTEHDILISFLHTSLVNMLSSSQIESSDVAERYSLM